MISSNKLAQSINPLELYTKNQLCSISANMWSRPATALFIELYRKLDCLWKTSSMYYRNKKRRHDALQEIATAIAPFRPDTTVEDVKNKINGIRTQYAAEKNRIAYFTKTNPSMEYEPSLWCYDRLSFLAAYASVKNKPAADESALTAISAEDIMTDGQHTLQVKIENDQEIEIVDISALSDSNEECDSSQQAEPYINMEPFPKRVKTSSDRDKIFAPSLQPEVTLTKAVKYKQSSWIPSEEFIEDERHSLQPRTDESVMCTENDDWIEVFGKFVTSQMKLVSNKTLLIKLQHTIQTAIMDAQMKQIELDKQ